MPHGAEKVIDLVEAAGAVVIAQESCTGLKPLYEDVAEDGDPLEAVARKYLHLPCSCMTMNDGRLDLLDDLDRRVQARRDHRPRLAGLPDLRRRERPGPAARGAKARAARC